MLNKVYVLLIAAFLLVGCRCESVENRGYNGRHHYVTIKPIGLFYLIVCDTSTNNAYLKYWNGKYYVYRIYRNSDRNPTKCNEAHR